MFRVHGWLDYHRRMLYLGLDIGGTQMRAAVSGTDRRILRRAVAPTPVDLDAGLGLLWQLGDDVRRSEPIAGIGVSIGGPLDWRTGVVSPLHQPAWRDVPLGDLLRQRFDCPVSIDVDTNVAAVGEYLADASQPSRLLYLTLSTGMGGGFIVDGRLYRGANGAHPEVAHQSIAYRCRFPERIECECGAEACLEALVSGNGIRRVYGVPAEQLDAEGWAEVADNLGQGLRNLAAIYAPERIVLGGSVALGGGAPLLQAAADVMRRNLRIVPVPDVRLSTLGADSPLLGALALASGAFDLSG